MQERDVTALRRDAHRKAVAALAKTTFPLRVGQVTVRAIGTIHLGKNYHNAHDIWPIKFRSEREHLSYIDPTKKAMYACEILDGGEAPVFRVTASDDPQHAVSAPTATRAWQAVRVLPVCVCIYVLCVQCVCLCV